MTIKVSIHLCPSVFFQKDTFMQENNTVDGVSGVQLASSRKLKDTQRAM